MASDSLNLVNNNTQERMMDRIIKEKCWLIRAPIGDEVFTNELDEKELTKVCENSMAAGFYEKDIG